MKKTAIDISSLRRLYSRVSRCYDILDWPQEQFRHVAIRRDLWRGLSGRILDLGAGTGRNVVHYPPDADVVTADISPEMLEFARRRLELVGRKPQIVVTDALKLDFSDGEFDACVSTFVFCVLTDAMQERAFQEIFRVLKPGGIVCLLEYIYSRRPLKRILMRATSPLVEALYGARMDRNTRAHLLKAGFTVIEDRFVYSDIILKLVGRKDSLNPFGQTCK